VRHGLPDTATFIPTSSGVTRTIDLSNDAVSIGFEKSSVNGESGVQDEPQLQRELRSAIGPYVENEKLCGFGVFRGPSAAGVPSGNVTSMRVAFGNGRCARNAIHRGGSPFFDSSS